MKATYALDAASVQALEKMAKRWAVSKSEALRRAISAAAVAEAASGRQLLERLDRLQRGLGLSSAKAASWIREIRSERRAGTPPQRKSKRR